MLSQNHLIVRLTDKQLTKGDDKMTENMFVVVNHNGMKFLAETKTNYMLPIVDMEALCIMFNYLYRHGELPNVDTNGWWKKKEFQEYYEEDEWGKEE